MDNLAINNTIKPPIIRKQAGRPCIKRLRKGAWKRRQTQCSNCLNWGHNQRTCRGQPVSSGRKERARDWLGEVVSGVLEEEEESSKESSDSGDDVIEVELGDKESDSEIDLSEVESAQFDEMEIDELQGVDTIVVDS